MAKLVLLDLAGRVIGPGLLSLVLAHAGSLAAARTRSPGIKYYRDHVLK